MNPRRYSNQGPAITREWLVITIQVDSSHAEWLSFILDNLNTQGIEAVAESPASATLKAYFSPDSSPESTLLELRCEWRQLHLPASSLRILSCSRIKPGNWVSEWRDQYQPLRVGRSFIIAPSWHRSQWPSSLLKIRMDPQNAFGSGTHASTRLCLLGIEEFYRPGMPALDVGTGSGILAVAMGLMNRHAGRNAAGKRLISAIDSDHDAIETARKNARRNGISRFTRFCNLGIESYHGIACDFLVTNLTAADLSLHAARLTSFCCAGATMLLAGLQRIDIPEIRRAFRSCRCRFIKVRVLEGWALLVMQAG